MAHFSLLSSFDRRLHSKFVRIVLAGSAVACLVAAVILLGGGKGPVLYLPPTLLCLLVIAIPAGIYANFWTGMMVGAGLIWPLNVVRALAGALFLLATLISVVILDRGLVAALLAYASVTLVQAVIMLAIACRYPAGGEAILPAAPVLLNFGLRSHASSVLFLTWTSLPLFVLGAVHGPAAAGIFGLSTQILDKLMLPALALYEAVYQRMRQVSREDAAREAIAYAAIIFTIAVAIGMVGAPVLYWMVVPLVGEGYRSIGPLTALLLLGLPFLSALLLLDPYFVNALQRPGFAAWLAALQLAITAALSALLIPYLETIGAAVSLVFAQAIGCTIALFALKRFAGMQWPSVLAAAAAGVQDSLSHMWSLIRRHGS